MKTLGEIASFVGGELRGDASVSITRIVHPAAVEGSSDLAFVLSEKAAALLDGGKIANAIVPVGAEYSPTVNLILVSRPRLVLAKLTELFERPVHVLPEINHLAEIHPTARLGRNVAIGPFCSVGPNSVIADNCRLISNVSIGANVSLGANTLLHAGVRVGDRCKIGSRVIIQPNVVIGGDGFAFVTREPGSVESVRQTGEVKSFNNEVIRIHSIGNVIIEDDVEIGAGTCIDRGTLGETRIGKGTKLDNLIQVGHNATIGENCLIVSQVGLGGSSKIGNRSVIGGQSGIPDHVTIGNDVVIHAGSGITGHVPDKSAMIGIPAVPLREFMEREVRMRRVPNLIKELKQQVEAVMEKLSSLLPPQQ
jgi:UDP-3-O-[3-hydroxymyristoyl] glucosamine N-acyltransferase